MKKNILRKVTLFLMVAMLTVQITGCNKGQTEKTESSSGASDYLISKEPMELTMFIRASQNDDGQWGVMKKAAEMTNVMGKTIVSKSNSDMTQAFNLMLASGDIADIVFVQDEALFIKYGMEGAFVPLNDYFDKMPNFKAFLDKNPEVKRNLTAYDGNIYYAPTCPDGLASTGWFIRQDWLDKLGLEIPKTADELYNVMKAFKTQDPNGNGKADEVPYFANYTEDVDSLFPLWNARPEWYVENGKVKYGPMQPEYKTAVENIIAWYNEGLIDREIITRTSTSRDKMLMDNVGGVTHDWFGSTARYNDTLKDQIPGFSFVPIAPVGGIEIGRRPANFNYGWGVYTGSKHVEEAVKYLDFWYSEAGGNLINFGEEGVHWEMKDGKPIFTDTVLKAENPQKLIKDFGCQLGIGYKQNFDYEKQWLNQIAIDGMEMYEKGNYFAEQMPSLYIYMSPEDSAEYTQIKTQIDTYSDEMFQKWFLGAENFASTYDNYLKELDKLKINKLIKLQQKAYEKYMKVK